MQQWTHRSSMTVNYHHELPINAVTYTAVGVYWRFEVELRKTTTHDHKVVNLHESVTLMSINYRWSGYNDMKTTMEGPDKATASEKRPRWRYTRPPSDPSRRGKPTKADPRRPHQKPPVTIEITEINNLYKNLRLKPNWRKFWLTSNQTVRSINYAVNAPWWRHMAMKNCIYTIATDAKAREHKTLNAMTTMNFLNQKFMWTLRCMTTGWIQIRLTTLHAHCQPLFWTPTNFDLPAKHPAFDD